MTVLAGEERTLEVRHECLRSAVEGINDHFAVRGASNLNSSIFEPRGRRRAGPGGILADILGLLEKVQ